MAAVGRVEKVTGISWFVSRGQGVVAEDWVLVGGARLLHVLVPPQLHPGKEEELDGQESAVVDSVVVVPGSEPATPRNSKFKFAQNTSAW